VCGRSLACILARLERVKTHRVALHLHSNLRACMTTWYYYIYRISFYSADRFIWSITCFYSSIHSRIFKTLLRLY